MQTFSIDGRSLVEAGFEALRKGDAHGARSLFARVVATGRGDASAWLGLALANRGLKDDAAKLAAIDQALGLEPRNLRALILKGDHFAEIGDARAATAFYSSALKAAPPSDKAPPELLGELRRIQAQCARYAGQYESHVRAQLAATGAGDDEDGRFARSLDMMFGRKRVYLQEPRFYYFPELPQVQFYERDQFPWLDAVEAATDDIRAEVLAVLEEEGAFTPYVEADSSRPASDRYGLIANPSWSAFFLWKNGELVPENAARCPKTLRALEGAPLARVKGRTPSVLFSLLRPGARIPPHHGFVNTRLICHLPLIVPENCGLRVGNDVRTPVEGKAWVFDDSIEHEAWNASDQVRVILLFDIWRPELSEEERASVAALFEAVDGYDSQRTEWDA